MRDNEEVRRDLQSRFAHFFVDEFQDTDPLQAEILLLPRRGRSGRHGLARGPTRPGKLFLVGDPKQSIYRFRRADVTLYEDVKRRLLAAGAEVLHLTTSFRAPPSIQRFVNAAFAPAMRPTREASQAAMWPLEPSRPEIAGRPTIIALPVPQPYGDYGKIIDRRIDESLPDAVGAFIDWLIHESGWTVEEQRRRRARSGRGTSPFSSAASGISATDVTRPYVRALEARRIPHVLVGGRSFHDREEVHGAAQRPHRHRVARRRAQGLCHAARPLLRPRRRSAARIPATDQRRRHAHGPTLEPGAAHRPRNA